MYASLIAVTQGGGQAAAEGGAFEPFFPAYIILLPLLGFVVNGILALSHARASANAVRNGGELDLGEPGSRPLTHTLSTWIGPGVMAGAFILTLVNFARMLSSSVEDLPYIRYYWSWINTGTLNVEVALQLDQLSMIMMLIITGVGFLIHVFSVGYMKEDAGYPRYFAYLNLFIFFMLVLVMGSSYALMFVGWEGVGLCSYLLIGYWFSDRAKADAGKKAFIVNRIGDVGFLLAIFLLYSTFGTLDFWSVFAEAETLAYGGGVVTAITLFFFLGAVGKSAQIPLFIWLPDAMAGPTPVSALIHAATMVTAGVYLVARSSVLFALAPFTSAVVAGVGVMTALFAATIALKQNDIKKVLAYSTVSQLGYMFVGVGVGAYTAGVFHLMTHAFFKALLFLGAGAVIHSMHKAYHSTDSHEDAQDMRNMGGLKAHMPITCATMWIATLAISGIWPFAGFFSKDEIIWQTGAFGGAANAPYPGLYTIYWIVALAAAMLTAFYMTRMMVMTFHGTNRTGVEEEKHLHEAPAAMWLPLAVLAVLATFGGWINVPEAIQDSFLGFGGMLPMSEWLHHWLEPLTAQAHRIQEANLGELSHTAPFGGGEVLWAVLSTVAALVVVVVTVRVVGRQKIVPVAEDETVLTGFSSLLYNKYYVDEVYDRFIVQPILRASRFCWKVIDDGIIDGIVNGVGWFAKGIGWGVSMFQTGSLNTYAFILTVGVLVILGASLL